jgi:hypothetical protein
MIIHLFFGKYLVAKGLIDKQSVINARLLQRRNNLKIGQLAKEKG